MNFIELFKKNEDRNNVWLFRAIGIVLLILLLTRLDVNEIFVTLKKSNYYMILLSIILVLPLIYVKTVRWLVILKGHKIAIDTWTAYLAYFSSILVGYLTPGRLGEFVRAVYVRHEADFALSRAISSVFIDRLFDFFALLIVGFLALFNFQGSIYVWIVLILITMLLVFILTLKTKYPLIWLYSGSQRFKNIEQITRNNKWIENLLLDFHNMRKVAIIQSILWTLIAYMVYYGQTFLLATSLNIPLGFEQISYSVALGSLITLIPISIAGLGTREAMIVAYLNAWDVIPELAISFSILVFFTFYLGGGFFGVIAWWIRPIDFKSLFAELVTGQF